MIVLKLTMWLLWGIASWLVIFGVIGYFSNAPYWKQLTILPTIFLISTMALAYWLEPFSEKSVFVEEEM